MRRHSILAYLCVGSAALVLCGAARPLSAQSSDADRAAVLSVVQRLFTAMAQRDTTAARALLMPGSRFVAIFGDGTGSTPRVQADTTFLRNLATGTDRLLERMWEPVVQLRGPLATVWAPYDFYVNGQRTHCGVDTFTLLRGGMVWRLSDISYTVERTGCADSPLGPPK